MRRSFHLKYGISATIVFAIWLASQAQTEKLQIIRSFPPLQDTSLLYISTAGFELGRYLFYDPILSADSTISCASCHQQAFAFGDSVAFSRGVYGRLTRRNTQPLFNLLWNPYFFWDGRAATLEEQIRFPIHATNEMDSNFDTIVNRLSRSPFYVSLFKKNLTKNEIDSTSVTWALSQFLYSLVSQNSKFDRATLGLARFSQAEFDGFEIAIEMILANCDVCHRMDGATLGTNFRFANNGLDSFWRADQFTDSGRAAFSRDLSMLGAFRVPSIRNTSFTAPYMHDGRMATIDEVLEFYSEHIHDTPLLDHRFLTRQRQGIHLSDIQKEKLKIFLRTLDDSSFTSDPRYSNPFGTADHINR